MMRGFNLWRPGFNRVGQRGFNKPAVPRAGNSAYFSKVSKSLTDSRSRIRFDGVT